MENALILTTSEEDAFLFSELLKEADISNSICVKSCEAAAKIIAKGNLDWIIIDTPLAYESGENFSRHIACRIPAQIILIVKKEAFVSTAEECGKYGILTISKPVDKTDFRTALSIVKTVQNRIKRVQDENTQLRQKIEDLRIIDRAKWILISSMKMSEHEAHRYIEKQAMDMRLSRKIIAEDILKRYEN